MIEWADNNPYLTFILLLSAMYTMVRIMNHYSYAKTSRRNENTLEKLIQLNLQRKKMNQQQQQNDNQKSKRVEDRDSDF